MLDDKVVSRALIEARERCGLRQEEIADKAYMKHTHYNKIESGQALPQVYTLMKIADAIGMKLVIRFEAEDE